jgi:hypothetical protein
MDTFLIEWMDASQRIGRIVCLRNYGVNLGSDAFDARLHRVDEETSNARAIR